jgi:hypothetical protein
MLYRSLFLSALLALSFALPAKAGFLDSLRETIDTINGNVRNINTLLQELGYTRDEIKSLTESLGVDFESVDVVEAESGNDVAIAIYREWSQTLSAEDAEIVQQLTLEYAADRATSIPEMMISDWYQGLPTDRQPRVIGLFAQFNQIIELIEDKNAFLAGVFSEEN